MNIVDREIEFVHYVTGVGEKLVVRVRTLGRLASGFVKKCDIVDKLGLNRVKYTVYTYPQ